MLSPDSDADDTAGDLDDRDPAVIETEDAGSDADGGDESDPSKDAAGGKRRDPAKAEKPDTSTDSDDSGDGFEDVLAEILNPKGKDDASADKKPDDDAKEEGEKTEKAEPDSETPDADEKDAEDTTDDAKPDGDAEEDEDPDDLSKEERERLPKKVNRQIDRLLKLKPAAKFADAVGRDAKEAGFAPSTLKSWIETGGRINKAKPAEAVDHLVSIALNVHTGGKAAKAKPEERANYLREIANRIHPAPSAAPQVDVIMLDDDLADAVTSSAVKKEDAFRLQRLRYEEKLKAEGKSTKAPPAKEEPEATETDDDAPRDDRGWYSQQDLDAGVKAAQKVYSAYKAKFPSDWPKIEREVIERVKERSGQVHPSAFAQLVKDQAELVIAKRKPASKTPPKGLAPTRKPPAKGTDEETGDPDDFSDELDQLTGKKQFAKR